MTRSRDPSLPRRPRGARSALAGALVIALCGCSGDEPAPASSANAVAPDAAAVGSASTAAAEAPQVASSHERMLAVMKEIHDNTDRDNPYLETRSLAEAHARLEAAMARGASPLRQFAERLKVGTTELNKGSEEEAVKQLTAAYELLPRCDFSLAVEEGVKDPATLHANHLRLQLGMAWMRLGELQNCCQRHTADSCILPIRGEGLHTRPEGSRNAIRYFQEIIDTSGANDDEESLDTEKSALWLLNVAYATLGEYPHGVPEKYLFPLGNLFKNQIPDFPRFVNVLPKLELDTFDLSGGAIVDDFDGDEYLDIVTSCWSTRGPMHYFKNNRDGTFTERTKENGLEGLYGGLNMVQADYDNDGDTDIFVLRGSWMREYGLKHVNSLLRNDGRGVFTDVTFDAGLAAHYPTKTGSWGDYDNDGDLDLYIGTEANSEVPQAAGQLFRNQGDGTFVDVAAEAGVQEHLYAMGCMWGDYDDDRWLDLYVSTAPMHNDGKHRLYHNNRDGTFTNVAEELGVTGPRGSFPAWFWDFDNDGNLDIYVSCLSGSVGALVDRRLIKGLNSLYKGDGKGGFVDVALDVGLDYPSRPMGANFGDLDNDGWLDFYLSTGNFPYTELHPKVMFLNREGKSFANVTLQGGFGHLQKGHGVAFADLDNDGDTDVYTQLGGAYTKDKFNDALFENPGFDNHFLTVDLEGRTTNRSAIGAKIRVDVVEDGRKRSIHRAVNSGGSFGCNPLRQMIGVGKATEIGLLEIYWPTSDTTQTFRDLAVDQTLRIVEGEERFTRIELAKTKLGGDDGS